MPISKRGAWRRRSSNIRRRSRSVRRSTISGISWDGFCCRPAGRWTRGSTSRLSCARGRATSMRPPCSGSPATWRATGSPRARAGASAAFHTGDHALAAAEYVALAAADRSRAGEAADGLERVAGAALAANDRTAVTAALTGLHAVAPQRPLGKYVRLVALDAADRGDTLEALAL